MRPRSVIPPDSAAAVRASRTSRVRPGELRSPHPADPAPARRHRPAVMGVRTAQQRTHGPLRSRPDEHEPPLYRSIRRSTSAAFPASETRARCTTRPPRTRPGPSSRTPKARAGYGHYLPAARDAHRRGGSAGGPGRAGARRGDPASTAAPPQPRRAPAADPPRRRHRVTVEGRGRPRVAVAHRRRCRGSRRPWQRQGAARRVRGPRRRDPARVEKHSTDALGRGQAQRHHLLLRLLRHPRNSARNSRAASVRQRRRTARRPPLEPRGVGPRLSAVGSRVGCGAHVPGRTEMKRFF